MAVRYRSQTGAARISVTQVLTIAGAIDTQWFTPESAERGRLVHTITEEYDRGEPFHIPEHVEGYVYAYFSFINTCKPEYESIEEEVQCDVRNVAGRIDRICSRLFGRRAILDIKTGEPSAWHAKQLAGYNLIRGELIPRYTLHLRKDGRYTIREHDSIIDYRAFEYDVALASGTVYANGNYWVRRIV